jgi:hypothetical protein
MNTFFLFFLMFFSIIGVVKTMRLIYAFIVQRINYSISKKEEDVKIWMKP